MIQTLVNSESNTHAHDRASTNPQSPESAENQDNRQCIPNGTNKQKVGFNLHNLIGIRWGDPERLSPATAPPVATIPPPVIRIGA